MIIFETICRSLQTQKLELLLKVTWWLYFESKFPMDNLHLGNVATYLLMLKFQTNRLHVLLVYVSSHRGGV